VQTDANERAARLSPDGRWLAFVANNSGAFEVYVQPFPGPGSRLQVSSKGAINRSGDPMATSSSSSRRTQC
jgi:Tol biopolymer transport system component